MIDRSVKIELWLDDNGDKDWEKITDVIDDDDDWKARHLPKDVGLDVTCRNPLTNEPIDIDETISWRDALVTFKADSASLDFKNLSIDRSDASESSVHSVFECCLRQITQDWNAIRYPSYNYESVKFRQFSNSTRAIAHFT
jgi:hypothetical protein